MLLTVINHSSKDAKQLYPRDRYDSNVLQIKAKAQLLCNNQRAFKNRVTCGGHCVQKMFVNSRSGAHASPALKSALVLVQTFPVPLLNNECKIVLKMAKRLGLVAHTSQHLGGRAVGLLSSRLARLCSETDRNKSS